LAVNPPNEAYVLVVEDNLKNFVLVARLLAYLGVKDCQWKAFRLAGGRVR